MNIAITGGTGFIGRHLLARHVALGDRVHYLTRKKLDEAIPGVEMARLEFLPAHGGRQLQGIAKLLY